MEDNIDYLNEITNKINEAKLLSKISPENQALAISLIKKKQEIKNKNGLFAQIQINHINKKYIINEKFFIPICDCLRSLV